jgi:aspartate/glutamate racemase
MDAFCDWAHGEDLFFMNTGTRHGKRHRIGIAGGIGALATVDFARRFLQRCTSALVVNEDSDFPDLVLVSSPLPECDERGPRNEAAAIRWLDRAIGLLSECDCTLIIVVCVSVSGFLNQIAIPEGVTVLSLVDETSRYLNASRKFIGTRILVLCSAFTSAQKLFNESHLEMFYLDAQAQRNVDQAILEVLKGNAAQYAPVFETFVRGQIERVKPQFLLLGCTELPLLLSEPNQPLISIVDPIEITITACLDRM